jgi:hypothetical protein
MGECLAHSLQHVCEGTPCWASSRDEGADVNICDSIGPVLVISWSYGLEDVRELLRETEGWPKVDSDAVGIGDLSPLLCSGGQISELTL